MNTNDLLRTMFKIAKSLENSNHLREADKITNLMIRVSQGPKWYDPNGKFYDIGRKMRQQGQTVPGLIGNAIVGDLKQSYKGLVPNQTPSDVKIPGKKSGIWWKEQLKKEIYDPGVMVRTLIEIGKKAGVNDAGSAAEIYLEHGPSFKDKLPLFIERSNKVPEDGTLTESDMMSFLGSPKGSLLIDHIDVDDLSEDVLELFVGGPATGAQDGTYNGPLKKLKDLQGFNVQ